MQAVEIKLVHNPQPSIHVTMIHNDLLPHSKQKQKPRNHSQNYSLSSKSPLGTKCSAKTQRLVYSQTRLSGLHRQGLAKCTTN